jgi:hypothetical protein
MTTDETVARLIDPDAWRIADDGGRASEHVRRALDYSLERARNVIEATTRTAEEPSAFLKFWWGTDGTPRTRVDLSEINEPWLEALKPTITPLYAAPPARTDEGLREALFAIADGEGDAQDIAIQTLKECGLPVPLREARCLECCQTNGTHSDACMSRGE